MDWLRQHVPLVNEAAAAFAVFCGFVGTLAGALASAVLLRRDVQTQGADIVDLKKRVGLLSGRFSVVEAAHIEAERRATEADRRAAEDRREIADNLTRIADKLDDRFDALTSRIDSVMASRGDQA